MRFRSMVKKVDKVMKSVGLEHRHWTVEHKHNNYSSGSITNGWEIYSEEHMIGFCEGETFEDAFAVLKNKAKMYKLALKMDMPKISLPKMTKKEVI